jgi:hypothetical protein
VSAAFLHFFSRNVPSDKAVAFLATEPDTGLALSLGISAVVADFAWISFCGIYEWIHQDRFIVPNQYEADNRVGLCPNPALAR